MVLQSFDAFKIDGISKGVYLNPGNNVLASALTDRQTDLGTYTKLKEITVPFDGTYTLTMSWKYTYVSSPGECRYYVNGTNKELIKRATSNYSVYNGDSRDIALKAGDKIQIYAANEGATGSGTWYVKDFRVKILEPVIVVDLD